MNFIFKPIRFVLGGIILWLDRLFKPKPEQRSIEAQSKVDAETRQMALYHFEACPFCVRVRRGMKRMNPNIELRDVKKNPAFEKELVNQGGMYQVPCLRIQKEDGSVQWMYESLDILEYFHQRFQR